MFYLTATQLKEKIIHLLKDIKYLETNRRGIYKIESKIENL